MTTFLSQSAAIPAQDGQGNSALLLLILIAVIFGWLALRATIRRIGAQRTQAVVHDTFHEFALVALQNAAQLDGRITDSERAAIAQAMRDIAGASFDPTQLDAPPQTRLTKNELVAYLEGKSRSFSNEQKTKFLKALLGVFVADGRFDEVEHQALVDYTAAVGYDRQGAPDRLRALLGDMVRDRIT